MEKHGITPIQLSKEINVPEQTIYSLLKRDSKKVGIDVLLAICSRFKVDVSFFADDNEGYDAIVDKEKPAGLMADELTENEKIFVSLPPNLRQEALKYMRYLAEQKDKR